MPDVSALPSHPCAVTAGAGGLIDKRWCLDVMAPVIRGLPAAISEQTVTRPELLVHQNGRVEVYYTPFDWVNVGARIVLIGICPGRHQMMIAVREARRVLIDGGTVAQALTAADATASFAGPMRRNLVEMLDDIGVQHALGIISSVSLFGEHHALADSTSLCNFAVLVNGENYGGSSPRVEQVPFLRAYVSQVLAAALQMTPGALVVPLGKAVSNAVSTLLVDQGRLDPRRCLLGFPHPSGQNGHRVASFTGVRDDLSARVQAWFSESSSSGAPVADPATAGSNPGDERQDTKTSVSLAPGPVTRAPEFPIKADPIHRRRPTQPALVTARQANREAKTVYLANLLSAARPDLRAAGLGPIRPYGHSCRIGLPADLPVAANSEMRLMASQTYTRLTLVTLAPSQSRHDSEALLELLRVRYADALAARLPVQTEVRWHARTAADVIDFAALQLHDGGYVSGKPATAATWAVACCRAWISVLKSDPLSRRELRSAISLRSERPR